MANRKTLNRIKRIKSQRIVLLYGKGCFRGGEGLKIAVVGYTFFPGIRIGDMIPE